MVYRDFLGLIAFLTILPVGKSAKNFEIENVSKNMFLFPIVGLIIGSFTLPIIVTSLYFFNQYIAAFIVTIFLIIITGVHHTDALADFIDGLMVKGNKEKKHQVMHDPRVGSAGAVAISGYIIGMTLAIASFSSIDRLLISIIIAEIVAKYSMVLQAAYSNSAWEGYSSHFTKNMKSRKKIVIASVVTIILITLISFSNLIVGFQILILGIICALIVIHISNRNLGGISGDVMGATNEIVRLVSLISVT